MKLKISKKSLAAFSILLFVLALSIGTYFLSTKEVEAPVQQETQPQVEIINEYSDRTCQGKTCTQRIYGGTRYVDDNGVWKNVTDMIWFNISNDFKINISYKGQNPVTIEPFAEVCVLNTCNNYSLSSAMTTARITLGNDFDLKIPKQDELSHWKYALNFTKKPSALRGITLKYTGDNPKILFDYLDLKQLNMTVKENQNEVYLNVTNLTSGFLDPTLRINGTTGLLEDLSLVNGTPNQCYTPYMKWNISGIPSSQVITDASMDVFVNALNGVAPETNVSVQRDTNQTWTEATPAAQFDTERTFDGRNNTVWNATPSASTWIRVNITNQTATDYGLSNSNMTIRIYPTNCAPSTFTSSSDSAIDIFYGHWDAPARAFEGDSRESVNGGSLLTVNYVAANTAPAITDLSFNKTNSTAYANPNVVNISYIATDSDGDALRTYLILNGTQYNITNANVGTNSTSPFSNFTLSSGFWNITIGANDTSNAETYNQTLFEVTRGSVSIQVNPANSTNTYPTSITPNCGTNATEIRCSLFRNSTAGDSNVTSAENNTAITFGVGGYLFRGNITQTENYTASDTIAMLHNITQATVASFVTISINGTNANRTYVYNQSIQVRFTRNDTDNTGITVSLWINSSNSNPQNYTNETSNNNSLILRGAGTYYFKANSTGNQNYSSSETGIITLTLNKASPSFTLFSFNTTTANKFIGNSTGINLTVTFNSSGQTWGIWSNSTQWINTTSTNATYTNTSLLINCASDRQHLNFTVYLNESANYSTTNINRNLLCDLTPPQYSNVNPETITSTDTSSNTIRRFNITLTDIDSGNNITLLEFNNVNRTAILDNGIYTATVSGISTGSYSFRWIFNDSVDPNVNTTPTYTYQISTEGGQAGGGGGGGAPTQIQTIILESFTIGDGICSSELNETIENSPNDCKIPLSQIGALAKLELAVILLAGIYGLYQILKVKKRKVINNKNQIRG